MKLLKTSDKVLLSFGDIKVTVKPLSYFNKIEAGKFLRVENGETKSDFNQWAFYIVKHSVSNIEGIFVEGDRVLTLEKQPDGSLTDDSTSDALNVLLTVNLGAFLPLRDVALSNAMPSLVDPVTGEKLDGVQADLLLN